MKKVFLVSLMVLVVAGLVYLGMSIHYTNNEAALRNKAAAQQKNLENHFDKTWKILSQQAQISVEAKDAFKEIYPALMEGRYGNARGGALLSFVKEHNPSFDIQKNYDTLMASVEALRTGYAREQEKLLTIKNLHDDARTLKPSKWFVGNVPELEIVIVTSAKTDNAFLTGQDNDVELFPKKTESNAEKP